MRNLMEKTGKVRVSQPELDLECHSSTLLTREQVTCAKEHNTPQKGLSMPL